MNLRSIRHPVSPSKHRKSRRQFESSGHPIETCPQPSRAISTNGGRDNVLSSSYGVCAICCATCRTSPHSFDLQRRLPARCRKQGNCGSGLELLLMAVGFQAGAGDSFAPFALCNEGVYKTAWCCGRRYESCGRTAVLRGCSAVELSRA